MNSVETALKVLEEVSLRQPIGVSELARNLELPKSNVQRALMALGNAGWITKQPCNPGRWSLAAKPAIIGQRSEVSRFRLAALPIMQELQQKTGEAIHLMAPEGDEVVLIARVDSSLPVRTFLALGSRSPMVAGANGKATLAHLPPDRVQAVIDRGLRRYTPTTITDPSALLEELERIRERGWAINMGELSADLSAVAAAILTESGPLGSMSISIPSHRFGTEASERLGAMVRAAAREIETSLALAPRLRPR